jgi:peptide/nickel transport system substrate-binding protein
MLTIPLGRLLATVAVLVLAATACGGSSGGGNQDELVVAATRTPEGLDQEQVASLEAAEIQGNLYDTLIRFGTKPDEDGSAVVDPTKLEPGLAESWNLSPDGLKVTFNLRHGAKSQAGNELTAEDVKWTYDRGLALGRTITFYLTSILGIEKGDPKAIEAVDKYTVAINLPKPNSLAVQLFTSDGLAIKDSTESKKHATTSDPWATKWLGRNAAGFGPYRVETWNPGNQIVLTARPDYWAGEPKVKRVVYREVPQSSNRLALVRTGEADLAEYLLPRELESLKDASEVKLAEVPGNFVYRVEGNDTKPPFNDPDVMQALNYLAPRADIIDAVYFGNAQELHSYIPSSYPGFSDAAWDYTFNPQRAKELLAKAGHADGLDITLQYDGGVDIQEQMAVQIKTAYKQGGVNVTLEKVPSAEYASKTFDRKLSFYFRVDSPWQPDPVYAASLWLYSKSFTNYSAYSNKRVDTIIDQMRGELNDAKRLSAAGELQKTVLADPPWVFLVEPAVQVPMKSCLTGYTWYLTSLIRFDDFDPAEC